VRRRLLVLLASAAGLLACGEDAPPDGGPTPPTLATCLGTPFTPAPDEGWIHAGSTLTVALGAPNHSMQDVLVTPGGAAEIRGKFAYGVVSKDLEGEKVRVFLDACAGWTSLGDFRTGSDGRIAVPVPAGLGAGIYDVRLQVLGDGSLAPGRIWVLPEGTHLAVSDIDGTLTTGDDELVEDVIGDLFEPILTGSHAPDAYPGAAALTAALAGRGYVVVYLTGRPYWLTAKTRGWLAAGGFAAGALHVADSNAEALPTAGGVGAYKLAFLRSLAAAGFLLDEAYGNATTDISAYAGAGVAAALTGGAWVGRCGRTNSTTLAKPAASRTAMSASTLRSSSSPEALRPEMNFE